MRIALVLAILMNILRLVAAEKEKKGRPNPEFEKLEKEAASNSKNRGQAPLRFDKDQLKERLAPDQYRVTQERGTERPYSGKYLRAKEDGIYTCVVCDNPLFRSDQKYEAGCGWPSFHDVMAHGKVTLTKDTSHGMVRTEVTCSRCGAHLGHVFDDGPPPTFQRFCINSAAMNFVPSTVYDDEEEDDETKDQDLEIYNVAEQKDDASDVLEKNEL